MLAVAAIPVSIVLGAWSDSYRRNDSLYGTGCSPFGDVLGWAAVVAWPTMLTASLLLSLIGIVIQSKR